MSALALLAWGCLAALYLLAAARCRRWPARRTLAWVGGTAIAALVPLFIGESPTLAAHMAEHAALIAMAAPLLAVGAPFVLALRVSRGGLRRGLAAVLTSRASRFLVDPWLVWGVFVLVVWAAHVPGLIALIDRSPLLHGAEHLLLVGLAFCFWTLALDTAPLPRRLSRGWRSAYLLAATPTIDLAALALMAAGYPVAGVAMVAGMLPLAAAGVISTWRWAEADGSTVLDTRGVANVRG